jgi:hypothetical protein
MSGHEPQRPGDVSSRLMAERYRCTACGNLTRFDVVATRRTRAFHHYTIAGDLDVADEEVLDEQIERVTCRWCSASGNAIELVPNDSSGAEQLHDQTT